MQPVDPSNPRIVSTRTGDLPNWDDRHKAILTEAEVKEIVEAWRGRRLVEYYVRVQPWPSIGRASDG